MVAIQQEGEGAGGGVSTGGSRGSDRLPPPRAGEGWGWGRVVSVQLMGCRLWAAPIPAFPRKRGRGRWWRFNKRGKGREVAFQQAAAGAGVRRTRRPALGGPSLRSCQPRSVAGGFLGFRGGVLHRAGSVGSGFAGGVGGLVRGLLGLGGSLIHGGVGLGGRFLG